MTSDAGGPQGNGMSGIVSYRLWRDLDSPSVRRTKLIAERPGQILVEFSFRVYRRYDQYRTEWLDGVPRRVFDGTTLWDFRDDGERGSELINKTDLAPGKRHKRYLYPLPPAPVESDTLWLEPISVIRIEQSGQSRIERVYPVANDRRTEVGYRHLIDERTGDIVRYAYGDVGDEYTEWRAVQRGLVLDDGLFTIARTTSPSGTDQEQIGRRPDE